MHLLDLSLFLGRFHPLVLHMPIGMMVLLSFYVFLIKNHDRKIVLYGLLASFIFSTVTIVFGLLLKGEGGYEGTTLSVHQNFGIAFGILQLPLIYSYFKNTLSVIRKPVFGVLMLLMTVTGHYGGNLTHGDTFLTEHAPELSSDHQSEGVSLAAQPEIENPDSAFVFENVIYPILDRKCIACHNDGKKKGDLSLSSYQAALNGGKHGVSIIPENAELSELLRRVKLPKNHGGLMPPKGKKGLEKEEIALLEWWIETGAKDSTMVETLEPNEKIHQQIAKILGAGHSKVFTLKAPALDSIQVAAAEQSGWKVFVLAEGSNAIRLKWVGKSDQPTFESVMPLAKNVYELQVQNMPFSATAVSFVNACSHLHFADLHGASQLNSFITALDLSSVEVLNLNDCALDDNGLSAMERYKQLKKLYLVGNDFVPTAIEQLKVVLAGTEVIAERGGFGGL